MLSNLLKLVKWRQKCYPNIGNTTVTKISVDDSEVVENDYLGCYMYYPQKEAQNKHLAFRTPAVYNESTPPNCPPG